MNDSKISVRYAKALLKTALEKKCEDAVRSDVVSLLACINESSDFKTLLDSPVIADNRKIEIFNSLFTSSFQKLTLDFFKVVVNNKRENFLKIICLDYLEFYAKCKNIKRVTITSAVETSADIKEKVKSVVKGIDDNSKIELSVKVEPEIIGGLIIQVEDKVYDASVKSQLASIKEKLSK